MYSCLVIAVLRLVITVLRLVITVLRLVITVLRQGKHTLAQTVVLLALCAQPAVLLLPLTLAHEPYNQRAQRRVDPVQAEKQVAGGVR